MCSVKKIWERQELLTNTIGTKEDETKSFNHSIILFYSVITLFLVFSIMELISFLAYEYWVLSGKAFVCF